MRFKLRDLQPRGQWLDTEMLEEYEDAVQVGAIFNVKAYVLDRDGRLLWIARGRNKVTNVGLNILRDMLGGTGFRPTHIAVGSGTTAPAASDTSLQTEIFRQKIDRRIPESSKMTFQILLGTADQNGNTFREVGLFEGTSTQGGNKLLARSLLNPVIAKTNLIQVTIAHEIALVAL